MTRSEARALHARFSSEGWNFVLYPFPIVGAGKSCRAAVAYIGRKVVVVVDERVELDPLHPLLVEILEQTASWRG